MKIRIISQDESYYCNLVDVLGLINSKRDKNRDSVNCSQIEDVLHEIKVALMVGVMMHEHPEKS